METPLIGERLYSTALLDPAVSGPWNRLDIVSGYATPAMVARHFTDLRATPGGDEVVVDLTVGMTAESGLRLDYHRGFVELASDSRFRCRYTVRSFSVHAKVYVWSKDGEAGVAYQGSANYSQVGMGVSRTRPGRSETISRVDAQQAMDFVRAVQGEAIDCTYADIDSEVVIYRERASEPPVGLSEHTDDDALVEEPIPGLGDHVRLTLLSTDTGTVHNPGGGLNHGQREGRKNKNEAYIPIPARIQRQGFFPSRGAHFLVSTDDGKVLLMSTGSGEGGKDLRTPRDNGALGEYMRSRLGIPNGAPFRDSDFARYGRADVDFYRIDDETYYMDFRRR